MDFPEVGERGEEGEEKLAETGEITEGAELEDEVGEGTGELEDAIVGGGESETYSSANESDLLRQNRTRKVPFGRSSRSRRASSADTKPWNQLNFVTISHQRLPLFTNIFYLKMSVF